MKKKHRMGLPPWLILAGTFMLGIAVDGVIFWWLDVFCKAGIISWLIPLALLVCMCVATYLVSQKRANVKAAQYMRMSDKEYKEYEKNLKREMRKNKKEQK